MPASSTISSQSSNGCCINRDMAEPALVSVTAQGRTGEQAVIGLAILTGRWDAPREDLCK